MRGFTLRFDAARDGFDDSPVTNFIKDKLLISALSLQVPGRSAEASPLQGTAEEQRHPAVFELV